MSDKPRTANLNHNAWVKAEIDPFVVRQATGARNVPWEVCEAIAARINAEFFDRDCNWEQISKAYDEVMEAREENPSRSGLSLGSVALGAALGAAAMHFTMKPKQ